MVALPCPSQSKKPLLWRIPLLVSISICTPRESLALCWGLEYRVLSHSLRSCSATLESSGISSFYLSNRHLCSLLEGLGVDKAQPGDSQMLFKRKTTNLRSLHGSPCLWAEQPELGCSQRSGRSWNVKPLLSPPQCPQGNGLFTQPSHPITSVLPSVVLCNKQRQSVAERKRLWVRIQALPLGICVMLGKRLHLSLLREVVSMG